MRKWQNRYSFRYVVCFILYSIHILLLSYILWLLFKLTLNSFFYYFDLFYLFLHFFYVIHNWEFQEKRLKLWYWFSRKKRKIILAKLKREILLKRFQTYHLTDDELDQFIFTRYKTSLEWDDFFYKANLNYPKFIHDELIYRIYNLQMFTYDNLFIFK